MQAMEAARELAKAIQETPEYREYSALKKACSLKKVQYHPYLRYGSRENDRCWHSCFRISMV